MKSIVLNYRIANDISEDRFNEILTGCYSLNYNVLLNIYDFSICKKAESYLKKIQDETMRISYIKKDFEELDNSEQIITDGLIKYGDSLALCILSENNVLSKGCIDSIDFEGMNNPTNGFIYFDYTINNIRCFLRSKGSGMQFSVPVIFWSMSKLIKYISNKNKFDIITSNYTGIHVAKNLCTVYQDDK